MAGTPDTTGEVYLLQRDSAAGGNGRDATSWASLLGRGGMAEVFAGQSMGSHGFQKPVAIKRLLPELANDTVFVERLIGEAKLLVGMQHGNIVSVLDLARDGDDVFLVMEFMDGPSVRQLLKARGTRGLPIGVATYIVQNAATGLEFAHGRPGGAVIHADISPSNILLTTSGEVRVADFGIARREGNGAGIVEGKWAYMAPEQARGESLTPRSDVFALGVVLYELITGQHPLGRQVTADERESAPLHVIPPRVGQAVDPGRHRQAVHEGAGARSARAVREDAAVHRCARRGTLRERLARGRERSRRRDSRGHAGRGRHERRPEDDAHRSPGHDRDALADQPAAMRPTVAATGDRRRPTARRTSSPPRIIDSGAQTRMVVLDQMVPVAAGRPMPAAPIAAPRWQPLPPRRSRLLALAASMLPAPELASVHGGNTFTGIGRDRRSAIAARAGRSACSVSPRWPARSPRSCSAASTTMT